MRADAEVKVARFPLPLGFGVRSPPLHLSNSCCFCHLAALHDAPFADRLRARCPPGPWQSTRHPLCPQWAGGGGFGPDTPLVSALSPSRTLLGPCLTCAGGSCGEADFGSATGVGGFTASPRALGSRLHSTRATGPLFSHRPLKPTHP